MDEVVHTDEPPFVRQRTDSPGILREVMNEMSAFQLKMQSSDEALVKELGTAIHGRLESACVLSQRAYDLAVETNALTRSSQEQMTEYVRTSQLQIQRLSEMTEACHREVVQMRAISIDAVSAVAAGQWSGSGAARLTRSPDGGDVSAMRSGNDGQCQSGSSNSAGNDTVVVVSMKSQSVVLSDIAVATSSRSAAGGGTGRRTVVVGGFKEDTRRAEIEDVLRSLVATWENKVDTLFAPRRGEPLSLYFLEHRAVCGASCARERDSRDHPTRMLCYGSVWK